MRSIPLETPLAAISGIGPRFAVRLKKLGIITVRDLLWHFPTRYEDLSQIIKISEAEAGMRIAISGVIEEVRLRRTARRNMAIVEASIADDSGAIRALWFNQPYLANTLRVGRWGNFAGKVAVSDELYLQHPEFELIPSRMVDDTQELRHTGKLIPIYPETKGLTSKGLRFLIQPLLRAVVRIPEWIPEKTLEVSDIPEINAALKQIHIPETLDHALLAKRRFAFEEIFLLQLFNLLERARLMHKKAHVLTSDIEYVKKIIGALPFELTVSQKRSLWEIMKDLERPQPMNRLLQGDVGSGKTVVAAIAAFLAAKNGFQTAFMAPTEILTRQHFGTLAKLVTMLPEKTAPTIGILTSSEAKIIYEGTLETTVKKHELLKQIKNGSIMIAVGTHALIEKAVDFGNLALVVIDEQHRFGVRQRASLLKHSSFAPHLLSMSATPIPRTLMLTIFGDLDISLIDELPAGRKPITTKIVPPRERAATYQFIREEIKNGRQAFVICPRIEPSANEEGTPVRANQKDVYALELKSVKEEYETLSKKVFPDLAIAMLHGKMPGKGALPIDGERATPVGKATKESVMKAFAKGEIDILVATSVVEVGVDIPNASVMMIEGSEHFGLAQLYQFRGRVGRSIHQSHCFLMTESDTKTTEERLKALLSAKSGIELAELDLKIRGPGEFVGQRQAGFPDYAMRALQDPNLIKTTREAALAVHHRDPTLEKFPLLKAKLEAFHQNVHRE